jgi:hypothetical protein
VALPLTRPDLVAGGVVDVDVVDCEAVAAADLDIHRLPTPFRQSQGHPGEAYHCSVAVRSGTSGLWASGRPFLLTRSR